MEIHAYTLYYELASTNPSSINWCHVQSNSVHDQNYFVAISYNWTLTWLYYFKKTIHFHFRIEVKIEKTIHVINFLLSTNLLRKISELNIYIVPFNCYVYCICYHVNSWNVFVFLNITFYYMQWPSMYHIRIWKLQKIHFLIYP